MELVFLSALILGMAGSLHCIGMCGPIAMLVRAGKSNKILLNRLSYNMGRVVTYALMGVVVGLAGEIIRFAGWQQGYSIALGSVIILLILFYVFSNRLAIFNPLQYFVSLLKKRLGKWISRGTLGSSFLIGFANGFLPCGLAYVALAGAAMLGHWSSSALYMILFGIGTIPALLITAYAGQFALARIRSVRLKRAIPLLFFLLGLVFVLRGMNLNIPYLSPALSEEKITNCEIDL